MTRIKKTRGRKQKQRANTEKTKNKKYSDNINE